MMIDSNVEKEIFSGDNSLRSQVVQENYGNWLFGAVTTYTMYSPGPISDKIFS